MFTSLRRDKESPYDVQKETSSTQTAPILLTYFQSQNAKTARIYDLIVLPVFSHLQFFMWAIFNKLCVNTVPPEGALSRQVLISYNR